MDKEQQIKEVSETYEDIKQGLEIGTERFLKNMKNVLEIEKKQAVKEFAEKLKEKCSDYLYDTNFDGKYDFDIHISEISRMIDELLKEYEK